MRWWKNNSKHTDGHVPGRHGHELVKGEMLTHRGPDDLLYETAKFKAWLRNK